MHWDLTKMYSGFDDEKLAADFAQAQALNQELADVLNSSGSSLLIQNEIAYSTGDIQLDVVEAVYGVIYGKSADSSLEVAQKISGWYADCVKEAGLQRYAPERPIDETKDYSWLQIRN